MHCFNLHKQQNALHNISITHSHDTMELPCKALARPSGATGVLLSSPRTPQNMYRRRWAGENSQPWD